LTDLVFGSFRGRLLALVLALLPLVTSTIASAETRFHVLVIGNNRAFSGKTSGSESVPLRYADDDAAAFFEFSGDVAQSG
jgi:hypothetical protein